MRNFKKLLTGLVCLNLLPLHLLQAQCPIPIVLEVKVSQTACHGDAGGSVSGRINGGTAPFTLILSGKAEATSTVNVAGGAYFFGGLPSGSYTLTVRDARFSTGSGCSTGQSFQISEPPELLLEIYGDKLFCSGALDGNVTGTVSGGTPPYTVLLNGDANAVATVISSGGSFNFSGLDRGAYSVTVIDAKYLISGNSKGCTVEGTALVLQSDPILKEVEAQICAGDSYIFGTQALTIAGTYQQTFSSSSGCDSIVSLKLRIEVPVPKVVEAQICAGGSYIFGTRTLTTAGTYQETFTSSSGCDSIVSLKLRIGANAAFELMTIPKMDTVCVADVVPVSVEISGGTPAYQISWYDNLGGTGTPLGTNESLFVNPKMGINNYLVKVSDADGCTVSGTTSIIFILVDATITPMDTSICNDTEEWVLTLSNTDARQTLTYNWQPEHAIITDPGDPKVMVDLTAAATFSVQVVNQFGCEETLTTTFDQDTCAAVTLFADPPILTPGESAVLEVVNCDGCEFLWSSGQTGSSITVSPSFTTSYSVAITTAAGCTCTTLMQSIEVLDCIIDPNDFFVPTAFTPNEDQVNDELCIRSSLEMIPDAVDILLIIYNRWGQEVFRSTSFSDCWDGTLNGVPIAPDVYGYHLQVMCRAETYIRKGDVSILR